MVFNDNQLQSQIPSHKPGHSYYLKGVSGIVILIITFYFGYQTGHRGFVFVPKEFKVVNQQNQPANVDYNLLWAAIKTVNEKYIDQPVDQQKILYGAVKGAVEAVGDPYTTFFPPKDLQNFQTQLKGNFSGIGAEVGKKDGNIVIVAPLPDTPAERAGIRAGDLILQVDGKSTDGWSVDQAVEKIRGLKGTKVTLNIFRNTKDSPVSSGTGTQASLSAGKPFDVTIVRDTIEIKSVTWQFKEQDVSGQKKTIAVIKLSQFGDDTKTLFDRAVNEILTKNVSGIILDLRNDPGGYLQTAVDIGSNWIKAGDVVVTEAKSTGIPTKYNAAGRNRLAGIKTVVLINNGSASAAEILAGALHDYKLAALVGEKSFGKGSVQELVDLSGGSAVKVTIAKWITPGGVNLNHDGLKPDIEVKLSEDDINGGKDPQMEKAVEEITKSK